MYFGIAMSPEGWFKSIILALFLVFSPIFMIGSFADSLNEPFKSIVGIGGNFILLPMLLGYWYKNRIKKTGRGSLVFTVYFFLYSLSALFMLWGLISHGFSLNVFITLIISVSVSIYMYTIIQSGQEILQQMYEDAREAEIQLQTEAIVRANQITKNQ